MISPFLIQLYTLILTLQLDQFLGGRSLDYDDDAKPEVVYRKKKLKKKPVDETLKEEVDLYEQRTGSKTVFPGAVYGSVKVL